MGSSLHLDHLDAPIRHSRDLGNGLPLRRRRDRIVELKYETNMPAAKIRNLVLAQFGARAVLEATHAAARAVKIAANLERS
jgi:hypothetical protein